MNKTQMLNMDINQKWYIIDAKGCKVGRLATEVAAILRGKNRASFHPSQNPRDYVIIINSQDLEVTGNKQLDKIYYRHSGRPGNLKKENFNNLQKRLPNKIIEHAIRKMLPKGVLGRRLFKNLKVYSGREHPHQAQNPKHMYIN
uniref:Large ribosomal subunit protein uL13c n=1 Tax=Dermonema virens TaxID=1077399 RepID=A0A1G4NS14_9FLOR|nr:Ribosomal protein L13 [Dermonema virens]SCW21405.1 Ribosomal protein L13 [Dermonema virens]